MRGLLYYRFSPHVLLLALLWAFFVTSAVVCQNIEVTERREAEVHVEDTRVLVHYSNDEGEESARSSFSSQPLKGVLGRGLARGSELLNQSIDSFMELFFYNLLDHTFEFKLSDISTFQTDFSRNLLSTPEGGQVVVDMFGVGPSLLKKLTEGYSLNPVFGIEGKTKIYNIYYVNDATRVSATKTESGFRAMVNNWMGMIPVLSAILPPSFNPNEMYDPVKLLSNPVTLPLSASGFESMDQGTIRSYEIQGATFLGTDILESVPDVVKRTLKNADDSFLTMPFSVYLDGRFKINVFKKSQNRAWLSVGSDKSLGWKFDTQFGRKGHLFKTLITENWWRGTPFGIFPVDFSYNSAGFVDMSQVYEVNPSDARCAKAYSEGMRGDLSFLSKLAQDQVGDSQACSKFLLKQNEHGKRWTGSQGPNLLLVASQRGFQLKLSEVKLEDAEGNLDLMRSEISSEDSFSDAVTGKQSIGYKALFETLVKRDEDGTVRHDEKVVEHESIQFTLELNDRFTNTLEFRNYIALARDFLALPLLSLPAFDIRDYNRTELRKKTLVFGDPEDLNRSIHVTPTYLGQFGYKALVRFSAENLKELRSQSSEEIIKSVERVFGITGEEAQSLLESKWSSWASIKWFATAPFEALNFRSFNVDRSYEAQQIIQNFRRFQATKDPYEESLVFRNMFATKYPVVVTRFLLSLLPPQSVARSVVFFAKEKGGKNTAQSIRDSFAGLDRLLIRSVMRYPNVDRLQNAQSILGAFQPESLRSKGDKKRIRQIELLSEALPEEIKDKVLDSPEQYTEQDFEDIKAKHVKLNIKYQIDSAYLQNQQPQLYVKVEDSRTLLLGSFVVLEDVYKLDPSQVKVVGDMLELGVYLTGPLTPFKFISFRGGVLPRLADGNYKMSLAFSPDGDSWSDRKVVQFTIFNGDLRPQ